jgi:hypothetical protein
MRVLTKMGSVAYEVRFSQVTLTKKALPKTSLVKEP